MNGDRSRLRRAAPSLALAAFVLGGFYVADRFGEGRRRSIRGAVSGQAADFRLPLVATSAPSAAEVGLADLRGKPAIVNFWASWCEACKDERSELQSLAADFGSAMVGIATMDRDAEVRRAETADPHGYRIALDIDGLVANAYRVDAVPQTFVVAGDGRILGHFPGSLRQVDVQEIRRLIAGVLR